MRHILLLLCLLILPTAVFASEASFDKHVAKGMAEFQNARYPAATDEFRAALQEQPNDPEATLYLGVALSRNQDVAAEAVLKKALALEPNNPLTNLELGLFYYNGAVFSEAGDYFENIITIAPGTEYSTLAGEYLREIKEKTGKKPWGIEFMAGMQYDSNVVVNSHGTPLPSGVSGKSDWRGILNAGVNYNLSKSDQYELGVGYSLYQSLHVRLTDFNVTQNLLNLNGKYQLGSGFAARVGYTFEYLLLGGDAFDTAHTVAPSLLFTSKNGYSTSIDYRFRDTTFKNNSDRFPTNTDRSGANHTVGATQKIPIGLSMMGRIGYYHDEEIDRVSAWDYTGNRWNAGLTGMLPANFLIDVSGEYYHKKYPDFSVVSREDEAYSGSISATKMLSSNQGITLSYYYIRNQSDASPYDYVRDITSLMFNARY